MEMRLLMFQLQIIIAVMVALLLRGTVMKKLPKVYSYILWILVFVRIFCPVTLEADFGIIPSGETSAEWVQQNMGGEPDGQFRETGTDKTEYVREERDVWTEVPHDEMREGRLSSGSIDRMLNAGIFLLPVVWGLGTIIMLVWNAFALLRIRFYIRKAELLKENIYLCGGIGYPFALGLFRPRIYIPQSVSEAERDYVICHEQVHIRRKDYLVKDIAVLLTAFYWFNPFVWIAFLFLERDMEMSCDERVISLMGEDIKRGYSQSLLDFAKGRARGAMTPLAFGENNVKQRVKNVLSYRNAKRWSVIAGILILAVAGVILFTVQKKEEKEGADEKEQIIKEEFADAKPLGTEENIGKSELAGYVHNTKERALDSWVSAFIERDGETLYALASDKEQFLEWDYVDEGEDYIAFGYSSPWPWGNDCDITFTSEEEAVIRYYMDTSVPEIYVADETVELVQEGNLYYVNHKDMTEYYSIESREQFEQLYGGGGSYDFTYRNTGYTPDFYGQLLRNEMAKADTYGSHVEYTEPLAAAKSLLHLGEGEGEVTYTAAVPLSENLYLLDSRAGEGSRAYVTYTFAKDNSVVKIPMELIEGSQGIWAPADSGMVRTVFESREITDLYEAQENGVTFLELSSYGIYLLSLKGMECVYPYYVSPDAGWAVSDGKLYFEVSSQYQEGDLDYWADAICVVDLNADDFTGKGKIYEIPEEQRRNVFPLQSIKVEDGILWLYGEELSYQISLE